jgi:dolichyl-phosphate beta-glucosyltransferase
MSVDARPALSVIIPAYNEAERLPPTLRRVRAWLEAWGQSHEIIVVDDGSQDDTAARAESLGAQVLRNGENRGKGYSVRRGMREARGARRLMTDADLSTPMEDLPRLMEYMDGGYGVVIASRALPGANIEVHQPWYRENMGRFFNLCVRALALPGLQDTQCGFKLFSAQAAEDAFGPARLDGFSFDVEALFLARRKGHRIAEIPVTWRNDAASRVSSLKGFLAFLDLLRIKSNAWMGRYDGAPSATTRSIVFMAVLGAASPAWAQVQAPEHQGTFSIIGRDPATGELGMAVQSKTIAVGARTRSGKGGLGVIAHQSASNPMYGELGIQLLQAGLTPQAALDMILRADEKRDSRQVAILDIQGRTAAWTSPTIFDWKGHRCGIDYCAQGNTLTGPEVVDAIAQSFESSTGPLAERLLEALWAGQEAGGDKRGTESAALWILKPLSLAGFGDRQLDLRVDESKAPIPELRRILTAVRSNAAVESAGALISRDLPGALRIVTAARDQSPEIDGVWVALANIQLRMGHQREALASIRKAVELNPANKRQLPLDPDFKALLEDAEFRRMVQ